MRYQSEFDSSESWFFGERRAFQRAFVPLPKAEKTFFPKDLNVTQTMQNNGNIVQMNHGASLSGGDQ
jgi:hypothetical protein